MESLVILTFITASSGAIVKSESSKETEGGVKVTFVSFLQHRNEAHLLLQIHGISIN